MTNLPLDGVRVLDLSQVYAGPTCTRLLADLGADVIKIEGLKRMDITRNFVMPENDSADDYWNKAGYFLLRNGGKRSLTLDFSEESGGAGIEIVKKLAPLCDIVVESFTPHVMHKLGIDYDSLRKLRPDVIMISLSGYGQDGAWRDFSAYGMGLEPASGISSLTGYAGGDPQRTGISFTDPYSGIAAAGAVLAALVYRARQGPVHRPLRARGGNPGHRLRGDGLRAKRPPAAAHGQPQPLVRTAGLLPLRRRRQLARVDGARRRRVGCFLRRRWAQRVVRRPPLRRRALSPR
jgi:Predicted acyl-CoA transferases/carnitine dehydratase